MDVLCCIKTKKENFIVGENFSFAHTIFKRFYTPFLMKTPIRIIVLIIFIVVLLTHVIVLPDVSIGLDQKLSMPADSYVLKYFQVMCLLYGLYVPLCDNLIVMITVLKMVVIVTSYIITRLNIRNFSVYGRPFINGPTCLFRGNSWT